ncbi:group II intron reverse transcriptase/maturase [Enterococcus faecium]|uniref:group II intron reverse transcriptase/maturase n=1 Tax=Enterococcus faecium TaxID=1352 RepID=UPI002119F8C6|nr:group II intron reverse transcriptase/maturase [Enterococcus faecium]
MRYNEYYNMQSTFDWLYQRSLSNAMKGINLYDIILSENNILLAYRVIKTNTGSKTAGCDKLTIDNYKYQNKIQFINDIREDLRKYHPDKVKRVMIPKPNGDKRPLGIPTMRDRLIQQMILQVIEPICEAKFYKHSYGFRPNRATYHAIARSNFLINQGYQHVVDMDIKGFFDNVNHSKLLSQLYTIGVMDRRVLAVISKILKSPLSNGTIPSKGTPQGGILSPLLSNVVLNDLDWWISSQWEIIRTRKRFRNLSSKLGTLRTTTNLKRMYIVRYADDFKIFTRDFKQAKKVYHAVKGYLENHLKLSISPEKSKITNLRKRSSEFLGFEIKAVPKRNKYVANTHVSKKNIKRIRNQLKIYIKKIQYNPIRRSIYDYNTYVLGVQNYYRYATHVNVDFSKVAYSLLYTIKNRLSQVGKFGVPRDPPKTYQKLYRGKCRTIKIGKEYLYPIADIKWQMVPQFKQEICNYTENGRSITFNRLKQKISVELSKLLTISKQGYNLEFTDNRISKYSMQNGKCAVTGEFLKADMIHCHHIIPKYLGGTDEFSNLVIIHPWVHQLIHSNDSKTIDKYLCLLKLNKKQIEKVNKYREKCNLTFI